MKRIGRTLAAALTLAALELPAAVADDAVAQDNATVQPAGPRMGDNGKAFFNVEGRPFMDNASFGVLEFNAADLNLGQISGVNSLTVTLVQSLASFTSRGAMHFYITTDNTTSIQPDPVFPALLFDPTEVHGLNGQLATLIDLGTGTFQPVRSGWVDQFTFDNLQGTDAEVYLEAQINSAGVIRIVVAPEMSDIDMELVGATYGGATNLNPALQPRLTVVPSD